MLSFFLTSLLIPVYSCVYIKLGVSSIEPFKWFKWTEFLFIGTSELTLSFLILKAEEDHNDVVNVRLGKKLYVGMNWWDWGCEWGVFLFGKFVWFYKFCIDKKKCSIKEIIQIIYKSVQVAQLSFSIFTNIFVSPNNFGFLHLPFIFTFGKFIIKLGLNN